jgi:hypothetical protein
MFTQNNDRDQAFAQALAEQAERAEAAARAFVARAVASSGYGYIELSHATLRDRDLAPAFAAFLAEADPYNHSRILKTYDRDPVSAFEQAEDRAAEADQDLALADRAVADLAEAAAQAEQAADLAAALALRAEAEAEAEALPALRAEALAAEAEQAAAAEDLAYYLSDLFEALAAVAPVGFYFGSHVGDLSSFGFWAAFDDPEAEDLAQVAAEQQEQAAEAERAAEAAAAFAAQAAQAAYDRADRLVVLAEAERAAALAAAAQVAAEQQRAEAEAVALVLALAADYM